MLFIAISSSFIPQHSAHAIQHHQTDRDGYRQISQAADLGDAHDGTTYLLDNQTAAPISIDAVEIR